MSFLVVIDFPLPSFWPKIRVRTTGNRPRILTLDELYIYIYIYLPLLDRTMSIQKRRFISSRLWLFCTEEETMRKKTKKEKNLHCICLFSPVFFLLTTPMSSVDMLFCFFRSYTSTSSVCLPSDSLYNDIPSRDNPNYFIHWIMQRKEKKWYF